MIEVFKFGGASVKDAQSVKNVASIIQQYAKSFLIVVVSAMGKTTNALENMLIAAENQDLDAYQKGCQAVEEYHATIINELFQEGEDVKQSLENDLERIVDYLRSFPANLNKELPDRNYDQLVAVGELLSTKIISAYFLSIDLAHEWMDARKLIGTDSTFKEAKVNFEVTEKNINNQLDFSIHKIFLTQGFIGSEKNGFMTTLGREGSDYSASIFAFCTNAARMVIWKDVPGFLNADPAHFKNAKLLSQISYHEAIELAFYGAKVIHPNTIKPIQNKKIPLHIKSFLNPEEEGTLIDHNTQQDASIPSYIFKKNQVLFSISAKDYSFINEREISRILAVFAKHMANIHVMQNSALNFSLAAQLRPGHLEKIVSELGETYHLKYNDNVEILTIRHYNEDIINRLIANKELILQQKTRVTMRVVFKAQ